MFIIITLSFSCSKLILYALIKQEMIKNDFKRQNYILYYYYYVVKIYVPKICIYTILNIKTYK